jgi:hypothetical protein
MQSEIWPNALKEERTVFENGVLRVILGPKREKVSGDGRKWYEWKLNNFYFSPYIRKIDPCKKDEMDFV